MSRIVCVVALSLLWQVAAFARPAPTPPGVHSSPSSPDSSTFEPLARWKAALQSGNEAGLSALYSKMPAAQVQTPDGTVQDPEAEARFWSALAAKGITNLNVKVLDVEHPQPGQVNAVLRVELMLKTNSGEQPFVVAVHQLWIQQGGDWRVVATRRGDLDPNPPRRLPEPAKPNTDLYAPPEEASSEISAALATAAKDHKRVILVFGANWCYDCHVLDATFHSKDIAPLVNANFHVVHINVGDEDKNLDLAAKYGVPINKGIPGLAVLNPDGSVVYSQKLGEFENSTRIGPADVTTFLKKWAPPHQG